MHPITETHLLALVERIAVALEILGETKADVATRRAAPPAAPPAIGDTPDLDEPDFSPAPTAKGQGRYEKI